MRHHFFEAILLFALTSVSCTKEKTPSFMPCKLEGLTSSSLTVSFTADAADDEDTYYVGAAIAYGDDPMLKMNSYRDDIAQVGSNSYTFTFDCMLPGTVYNVRSYIRSYDTGIYRWGDMMTVTTQDYNPEEVVDLGLSAKWRAWNLGATKPQETGLFYQWGDTQGYGSDVTDGKYFDWADQNGNSAYKWCNGSKDKLTKYTLSDNISTLQFEDDAASVALGNGWRLPSYAEWQDLLNSTYKVSGSLKGVSGVYFYSKKDGYKDKFLFFPIIGYRDGDALLTGDNDYTYYWTSTVFPNSPSAAYSGIFRISSYGGTAYALRCYGAQIRPVTK